MRVPLSDLHKFNRGVCQPVNENAVPVNRLTAAYEKRMLISINPSGSGPVRFGRKAGAYWQVKKGI